MRDERFASLVGATAVPPAAIGDFDEDGRPDFVTTDDGSGDLSVFLRVGDGP